MTACVLNVHRMLFGRNYSATFELDHNGTVSDLLVMQRCDEDETPLMASYEIGRAHV